jgi:hypothetical protein
MKLEKESPAAVVYVLRKGEANIYPSHCKICYKKKYTQKLQERKEEAIFNMLYNMEKK